MARDTQSIVKMSRREGYALHPKAVKYLLKRSTVPGQHGRTVRKNTGQFNVQLREKQKVKRLYGLLEKQFARLMNEASRTQGQSGASLLQFLERRLDNAVYRAGFAVSRRAARQLVTHGHFMVNGRRVDVPSIRLKLGDEVVLRDASKANEYFKRLDDVAPSGNESSLSWLAVERKKVSFKVTGLPTREEAEPEIQEQLIVEYYSR
jgi:small subunit ribosomal protein S4